MPKKDSNLHNMLQRHGCYHYTIGQLLRHHLVNNAFPTTLTSRGVLVFVLIFTTDDHNVTHIGLSCRSCRLALRAPCVSFVVLITHHFGIRPCCLEVILHRSPCIRGGFSSVCCLRYWFELHPPTCSLAVRCLIELRHRSHSHLKATGPVDHTGLEPAIPPQVCLKIVSCDRSCRGCVCRHPSVRTFISCWSTRLLAFCLTRLNLDDPFASSSLAAAATASS